MKAQISWKYMSAIFKDLNVDRDLKEIWDDTSI